MFDFEKELHELPDKPGVYLMHNSSDAIIYVGKAISLKNRVRQYFQSSRKVTPKIEKMISNIAWFEYIVTDSELEALVLENNLIKEHSPRYNTMLKDDKTYPYIKATVGEAYPRLIFTRQMKRDGSRYFGPFTSSSSVREVIELVNKLYHLRNCNKKIDKSVYKNSISNILDSDKNETNKEKVIPTDVKNRPCLYYQMGICPAPCVGAISSEEYKADFDKAIKFLQGDTGDVIRQLKEKMKELSEEMNFEEAATYRDRIDAIRRVTEKQKITSDESEDRDILAMARQDDEVVMQVFFIREGKLLGREHYYITGAKYDKDEDVISTFIRQMYSGTPYLPREIVTEKDFTDREVILEWLSEKRGHKVYSSIPERGDKKRLLELAKKNAYMTLIKDSEKLRREHERTVGAMEEIEGLLGITELHRVESYDISHINGFETVGSMVVFEDGKSKKNDYRKFKIRSVSGPDDYGSMDEMLTRRFEHSRREGLSEGDSFSHLPDIIFMDGGKGQVHVCEEVLARLDIDVPVCGMVKDDHHRTRGLYFHDEEIPIDTHGEGFHLITRIQDETHRFAIEYHKQIRSKGQVHSILDDIPGVGPKKRLSLMQSFKSLEDIRDADTDKLVEVAGIDRRTAQNIVDFFQNNEA